MICELRVDKKVLLLIIFALAVTILLCSCALGEPYPYKSIKRVPINEECRVFHNWGIPDAQFRAYVYYMVEGTDWIDVKVIRWTGVVKERGSIITMVVYYAT